MLCLKQGKLVKSMHSGLRNMKSELDMEYTESYKVKLWIIYIFFVYFYVLTISKED